MEQPAVVRAPSGLRELRVVTFLDLIEVQFVHAFRTEGVSWPTIRLAATRARELTGVAYPFASREFVTDGRTIFAQIAQTTGNRELLDLRTNQMASKDIFLPSLRANLDLGPVQAERLWPLGKRRSVVIDPARQFGQPIVKDEGVPTVVLARAAESMGSVRRAAMWHDVSPAAVRASVEFEDRLAENRLAA